MTPERSPGSSREDSGERDPNEPFELRPASPVTPGSVVAGKYRIDRHIGFGGMGVVCEGTHLELGTKVAIKFVRMEHSGDDRAVARFLTEARSAAQLRSQHTCRVVDCGRLDSGSPYMVMEHLEGADLRTIANAQAPLPVAETVSFALQACEALAEAHARGIVHRDIKPENLFLTQGPDGSAQIKVLDFGISKQLERSSRTSRALTEPTESIGSPFHMSPEQMIDPTTVDGRTDVWSLGVVLYELLTGQLPFVGETTPQICANVMTRAPVSPTELNPEVPEALSRVVLGCLEKNREARYADMAALSRALEAFAGKASTVAADRVERILSRAREAASVAREPVSNTPAGSGTGDAGDASDAELARTVPGLPAPRRSLSWLLLAAGLGGAGYLHYATRTPEPAPLPPPLPSAPHPEEPAAATRPARPEPSQPSPERPKPRPVKRPKAEAPRSTASPPKVEAPESAREPLPTAEEPPAVPSTSLYPEIKPVPDMPAAEPPAP